MMRILLLSLLAVQLAATPAAAAAPPAFSSAERISAWMNRYREAPSPRQMPAAVQAMKELNLFRDPEASGFVIGFAAGVLGQNPERAEALVEKMFPMPPKEQAAIIKAIAYSGLPEWKALLARFAARMSERWPMVDDYLSDKAPTLMAVPLEEGTQVVHTLWGYYVATGQPGPVLRVIEALAWTKPKDQGFWRTMKSAVGFGQEVGVDKLTVAGNAKWTLVFHAERDRALLDLYRDQLAHAAPEIKPALEDVVAAAERFEGERVRKEEAAVVQEEQARAAQRGTPLGRAAYAGSVALSGGCMVAGALGHPEIAVPCVITGVVYTGAQKLWNNAR